jgi:hypothetical protein
MPSGGKGIGYGTKLRHPDRSEAEWRDLFSCLGEKRRSLDFAARWAASLGMTECKAWA